MKTAGLVPFTTRVLVKERERISLGGKAKWGMTPASVKCFKCGESGHHANGFKNNVLRCFKCGKTDHRVVDCRSDGSICYNYGEKGHINTNCQKPNKAQPGRTVFVLIPQD